MALCSTHVISDQVSQSSNAAHCGVQVHRLGDGAYIRTINGANISPVAALARNNCLDQQQQLCEVRHRMRYLWDFGIGRSLLLRCRCVSAVAVAQNLNTMVTTFGNDTAAFAVKCNPTTGSYKLPVTVAAAAKVHATYNLTTLATALPSTATGASSWLTPTTIACKFSRELSTTPAPFILYPPPPLPPPPPSPPCLPQLPPTIKTASMTRAHELLVPIAVAAAVTSSRQRWC